MRFGPWADLDFVSAKVKETYGMNNHVHFPNENAPAARPVLPMPNEGIVQVP